MANMVCRATPIIGRYWGSNINGKPQCTAASACVPESEVSKQTKKAGVYRDKWVLSLDMAGKVEECRES